MSWQWVSSLNRSDKVKFAVSFALLGVLVGSFVGLYEGLFILIHQRHNFLSEPAVGPAILLLAPLVDALGYGFLGGMLGVAAVLCRQKFPGRTAYSVAIGLAIPCAHLTLVVALEWIRIPKYSHVVSAGFAFVVGLMVAGASLRYWPIILPHGLAWHARLWPSSRSLSRKSLSFTGAALISLATLVLIMTFQERGFHAELEPHRAVGNPPNIVMIALDTARADHISAYGYTKPTTPNLDKLAEQGVLFETAIAPAPWTLPSFATVFTGLLPHQNAATSKIPLAKGTPTLASILASRGYQTAGFNANARYGTARSGIAQGFGVYNDDDLTLRTDLVSLGLGKAFWWFVYYPFIRPQNFPRRDAHTLNQSVFRWFRNRSTLPFLLLINYFDVHEPYRAIPEVGDRFGNARSTLSQRIRSEVDGMTWGIDVPRSPAEQATLIAGYDSGLAYADSQIGDLLQLFQSSPDWSNTYIIIFGDHGQSFGTHGRYGHGCGLNWELLHVPLIIAGPGIPPGRRVKDLVSIQQLFATALDLSGTDVAAADSAESASLRGSWEETPAHHDSMPMVISEFGAVPSFGIDSPSISVLTPQWHFIRNAAGDLQLYDVAADRGERVNLAGAPEYQTDVAALQQRLFEKIQTSSPPWRGEDYLWALGDEQLRILAGKHLIHASWPSWKHTRPSGPEDEVLRSLPYQ